MRGFECYIKKEFVLILFLFIISSVFNPKAKYNKDKQSITSNHLFLSSPAQIPNMARYTAEFFALVTSIVLLCNPAPVLGAVIGERAAVEIQERAVSNVAPLTTDPTYVNNTLSTANTYRPPHSAVNFTWNATLAAYAQVQANKCVMQHSVITTHRDSKKYL
jgi:hypothetical protein